MKIRFTITISPETERAYRRLGIVGGQEVIARLTEALQDEFQTARDDAEQEPDEDDEEDDDE